MDQDVASSLVARYGTPLYAYDLDEVRRRAAELSSLLPAGSRLLYSLKANPLPEVGAALKPFCSAEVSSSGELAAALAAGFERSQILYTGPGKTEPELEHALREETGFFSGESCVDVARLARVATRLGRRPRVLLRINPARVPGVGLAMAGGSSQFGLDEATLLGNPTTWQEHALALEFVGVHVYVGTQLQETALVAAFRLALATARRVAAGLGLPFRIVDVGGGFSWPFATAGPPPCLAPLRQPLAELFDGATATEVWFESGRYLCASSGTLLATVLDVKVDQEGRRYVVLDAGINLLGGMAGLGRVLTPSVSLLPLANVPPGDALLADVVGPLCTPLDTLARRTLVPPVEPGSIVGIPNVGAYGLSASLVAFLSRPGPIEVAYDRRGVVAAYRLTTTRVKETPP